MTKKEIREVREELKGMIDWREGRTNKVPTKKSTIALKKAVEILDGRK